MSGSPDPDGLLSADQEAFVAERHLAILATVRPDGSPHTVPVGFSWDRAAGLVRVICSDGGVKVRNIEQGSRAAVSQVDGPRWISLEGPATVTRDPEAIAEAERRYTARYQPPRPNERRVAIEIRVERVLGRGDLTSPPTRRRA